MHERVCVRAIGSKEEIRVKILANRGQRFLPNRQDDRFYDPVFIGEFRGGISRYVCRICCRGTNVRERLDRLTSAICRRHRTSFSSENCSSEIVRFVRTAHRDFRFCTAREENWLSSGERGNDWIVLFNHRCRYDVTYWTLIILYIFKYTLFIVLDNGKVSRCLFLFTHPFVTRYRQHHVPTSWKNSLKLRRGNGAKMFKDHKDFHRWESFIVIVARTQACNYRTFINNYF